MSAAGGVRRNGDGGRRRRLLGGGGRAVNGGNWKTRSALGHQPRQRHYHAALPTRASAPERRWATACWRTLAGGAVDGIRCAVTPEHIAALS